MNFLTHESFTNQINQNSYLDISTPRSVPAEGPPAPGRTPICACDIVASYMASGRWIRV
jgi:hypothetical protein